MWLLNAETRKLEPFLGLDVPQYAILSHRWEIEEVSFKDMMKQRHAQKRGWNKIDRCCKQALSDGLQYVWIDTCCIDKKSSNELAEAINSMYRWYNEAQVCYAFLSDVSVEEQSDIPITHLEDTSDSSSSDGPAAYLATALTQSLWFTRGWTLQELLAPSRLLFFDQSWTYLGTKLDRCHDIERFTTIPVKALQNFVSDQYSIAQKMSWAAGRRTTRLEDRAYSLLGIFNVYMPLVYGEGSNAFIRLQDEILKISDDNTIFAWSSEGSPTSGMLAESPDCFEKSEHLLNFRPWDVPFKIDRGVVKGEFIMIPYTRDIYFAMVGFSLDPAIEITELDVVTMLEHVWKGRGQAFGMFLIDASDDVASVDSRSAEDNIFRRVKLDKRGSMFVKLTPEHAKLPKLGKIEIARTIIEDVSTSLLTINDFEDGNQVMVQPALFYTSQTEHEMVFHKRAYHEDHDLIVTKGQATPTPCISVSRGSESIAILQFQLDMLGLPTVVVVKPKPNPKCPGRSSSAGAHVCCASGCASLRFIPQVVNGYCPDCVDACAPEGRFGPSTLAMPSMRRPITFSTDLRLTRTIEVTNVVKIFISESQQGFHLRLELAKLIKGGDRFPKSWLVQDSLQNGGKTLQTYPTTAREHTIVHAQEHTVNINEERNSHHKTVTSSVQPLAMENANQQNNSNSPPTDLMDSTLRDDIDTNVSSLCSARLQVNSEDLPLVQTKSVEQRQKSRRPECGILETFLTRPSPETAQEHTIEGEVSSNEMLVDNTATQQTPSERLPMDRTSAASEHAPQATLTSVDDFITSHYDGVPLYDAQAGIADPDAQPTGSHQPAISRHPSILNDAQECDDELPPYVETAPPENDHGQHDIWTCPVCLAPQLSNQSSFNNHLDTCLNQAAVSDAMFDHVAYPLTRWLNGIALDGHPSQPEARISVVDDFIVSDYAGLICLDDRAAPSHLDDVEQSQHASSQTETVPEYADASHTPNFASAEALLESLLTELSSMNSGSNFADGVLVENSPVPSENLIDLIEDRRLDRNTFFPNDQSSANELSSLIETPETSLLTDEYLSLRWPALVECIQPEPVVAQSQPHDGIIPIFEIAGSEVLEEETRSIASAG